MPKNLIAVIAESLTCQTQAKQIALDLNLPLVTTESADFAYFLAVTPERLELRKQGKPRIKPLFVDFLHGKNAYRNTRGKSSELISKAIGIKGNKDPKVLDATAGFGGDSYVLANLGCDVIMIERSKIMALLLADGLKRLFENPAIHKLNLKLILADAKDYLAALKEDDRPDVIYLDPMYPNMSKTALSKISMLVLRDIVGDDCDALDILLLALKCANKRVVVKRPRLAPELGGHKPDIVFIGKSSRFDVYTVSRYANGRGKLDA